MRHEWLVESAQVGVQRQEVGVPASAAITGLEQSASLPNGTTGALSDDVKPEECFMR
ncbi:MAG: hypothetical protein KUG77_02295 [Nannocystaceae bacterium]|nr:hypothetical protein [Nannocystaceae bacterium]